MIAVKKVHGVKDRQAYSMCRVDEELLNITKVLNFFYLKKSVNFLLDFIATAYSRAHGSLVYETLNQHYGEKKEEEEKGKLLWN